ncbi:cytochrome P450 monooxygenase [Penicillium malachiteum]|uniref:cytochrome P450 monooxygenase n=1 Tax=Penicillium malachiteum TaxID=1324776 RepID=UPI002547536F|nr:cytochrome P450 monooxygenase [Penicillium malachiteum]KAJ5720940.1 cytochrome P450 monooxygenase [Penicillium malachiteum]
MGFTIARSSFNESLIVIAVGGAAALYFKPEYAIGSSRPVTAVILVILITLAKIIYELFLYPKFFTPLIGIPTPADWHFLKGNGNTGLVDTPHDLIREWAQTIPNNGLIRYYIVGQIERVVLTDPKAYSEILVTKAYDFVKPEVARQQLRRVVGDGLLLAEGDEHKFQCKNLMPAFAYRHIKDLYPIFWAKSSEMVKLIRRDLEARESTEDNTIQVRGYASRATLDIIGLAGMGHDFDSLENPDNDLYQSYRAIFTPGDAFARILFMIGMLICDMRLVQKLPTKRNRAITKGREVISRVARQMVREKKAKMEDPKADAGIDIISVAMTSGTFEEENLIDQLMTFLAAGHETTSGALQWCIYALCKNPKVQDRLREEVHANLPPINVENPEPITAGAIDDISYLNAVCNEVLRFYPSVRNTVRVAVKDTSILGQPIPKDTFLIPSVDLLNHSPELWGPDADKFNPDRWMAPGQANTGGATSNYAFMTFLHGPHSCIGQSFSRSELACLLAAVVGSFKFEFKYPDAELKLRRAATVTPLDGVLAKFTPLEGW